MDTEALRLFVLAAEKLNISAAGRDLGMAPAVSSARLAKLEKTVGADLLHRSTRKVALSLEGAEFLPFAREIIAQEEAAMAALGKGETEISGTLRFTAPSSFAQLYIAPIVAEFLRRYPGITLDMRLSDAEFDLIDGSFDLALRNMVLDDSSMKGRKIADDTRVLCAAPAYIEAFGLPEGPDDLAKHQLIAFKNLTARTLHGPDGRSGIFEPRMANGRLIIDNGTNLKAATVHGAGISINSIWNVDEELRDGRLRQVLPGWTAQADTALWLVYPKSNVLSPKVRVFLDYLIDQCSGSIWAVP
ncbi:LysR family transcriptional regulator [uncultured Roseobacter sp.]|uniref:LysR family transcriptional regulator n=1 Tax=uncultured Roseobacter sp. TaxID=114847 RepID=UPI00261630B1|nr:LysR family transcriptional regulator [uncultured Roseobacter sp.]